MLYIILRCETDRSFIPGRIERYKKNRAADKNHKIQCRAVQKGRGTDIFAGRGDRLLYHLGISIPPLPEVLRFAGLFRYQNVINNEMHFFILLEISRKIKKFEIKREKVWR